MVCSFVYTYDDPFKNQEDSGMIIMSWECFLAKYFNNITSSVFQPVSNLKIYNVNLPTMTNDIWDVLKKQGQQINFHERFMPSDVLLAIHSDFIIFYESSKTDNLKNVYKISISSTSQPFKKWLPVIKHYGSVHKPESHIDDQHTCIQWCFVTQQGISNTFYHDSLLEGQKNRFVFENTFVKLKPNSYFTNGKYNVIKKTLFEELCKDQLLYHNNNSTITLDNLFDIFFLHVHQSEGSTMSHNMDKHLLTMIVGETHFTYDELSQKFSNLLQEVSTKEGGNLLKTIQEGFTQIVIMDNINRKWNTGHFVNVSVFNTTGGRKKKTTKRKMA